MQELVVRNVKMGFATNSSSYHSTLILTEEEYNKWVDGKIKIEDYYGDEVSYDECGNDSETNISRYTSPSGDKLVILCEHRYN